MESKIKELCMNSSSAEEFCQKMNENGFAIDPEEAEALWERNQLLNTDLSEEELAAVSGGGCFCCQEAHPDDCKATVEAHSFCRTNDACGFHENQYESGRNRGPVRIPV